MNASEHQTKERQYYIDWLRILLILSVFLFHIGMIFNSWDWHVKNDVTYEYKSTLWYIMVYLGRWRMPLLILISGAGTWLALGKRTSGQYLKERFKRLFIPLLIGIFTLVPIQVFIEKSAQFDSLFDFYPHMFEGIYPEGNFSWHHLWFIAYLFFIALLISPFLNFFRSNKFNLLINGLSNIVSKKLGANIFVIPLILSQLLLRPYFPENTHALIDDWAAISYYIIFFLLGFIIISNKKMVESIRKQKHIFLIESSVATIIMFTIPYMVEYENLSHLIWDVSEVFVAWLCGLAAIGYAKQYLNFNNRFRKLANEAIYPFYLLHQPIIVIVAYFMVQWDIAIIWKAAFITLTSLILTVAIYWLLIRQINVLRFIFGMKVKSKIEKIHITNSQPEEIKLAYKKVQIRQ